MEERGTGWDCNIDQTTPPLTHPQTADPTVGDSVDITHDKPLYAVVKDHLHNWEAIGAPPHVLSWIREGVHFETTEDVPPFFHAQLSHSPEALQYWNTKLKPHYLASGAIRRIPPPPPHRRHISKCFFVAKSSGGHRLVIDLRKINSYFPGQKIKFEDLSMLRFVPNNF